MRGEQPTLRQLGLPGWLENTVLNPRGGLIVVCGPPGSGVSTTLRCLLDVVNRSRRTHLMTFEDRIEVDHFHKLSMVSQRERDRDFHDLPSALLETSRQGAGVVMIDRLGCPQAMAAAAEIARGRQTVLAGMEADSVTALLERASKLLSERAWSDFHEGLSTICYQRLLLALEGHRQPALEILVSTSGVSSLLRERKFHLLYDCMQSGGQMGMQTLDQALHQGVRDGRFSRKEAARHATDERVKALILGTQAP